MNKYQLYVLGGALLAATSLGGCVSTAGKALPPDATPAQVQAAKAADAQASFDRACGWANGEVAATAKPYLPAISDYVTKKLGKEAGLAFSAFFVTITVACDPTKPLDINSAADITQRVYDAGGNVLKLIFDAQKT